MKIPCWTILLLVTACFIFTDLCLGASLPEAESEEGRYDISLSPEEVAIIQRVLGLPEEEKRGIKCRPGQIYQPVSRRCVWTPGGLRLRMKAQKNRY